MGDLQYELPQPAAPATGEYSLRGITGNEVTDEHESFTQQQGCQMLAIQSVRKFDSDRPDVAVFSDADTSLEQQNGPTRAVMHGHIKQQLHEGLRQAQLPKARGLPVLIPVDRLGFFNGQLCDVIRSDRRPPMIGQRLPGHSVLGRSATIGRMIHIPTLTGQ